MLPKTRQFSEAAAKAAHDSAMAAKEKAKYTSWIALATAVTTLPAFFATILHN
jgi:hypothetical protein